MTKRYHYDIHALTTICSDVWLPELAAFAVDAAQAPAQPTLTLRIGAVGECTHLVQAHQVQSQSGVPVRSLCYKEKLGALGFGVAITIFDVNHIEVVATSLLRYSLHVLYTNIVEPILRWNFVEKGYALVHSACLARGTDAFLVTAPTDTGKTTTVLRILDEQKGKPGEFAFVADDLTLLAADGRVMSYPKPLTVSGYMVAAVQAPALTQAERLALPLQSSLHSRSGRRLALFLAKTRLPMATINAVIQMLVPPPKYPINQLISNVKMTSEARVAGLFVIERAGEGEMRLSNQEAIKMLLRNGDDAYGFPPYQHLESFLRLTDGVDLRDVERRLVTQALRGQPALLLRSTKLDWAQRIPTFINRIVRPRFPAWRPSLTVGR